MYLDYYRFKKNPFHITPDPEFLFLSESHKEASAALIYGIEERKGFIAITGEIGVGKTTILRAYLENADTEKLKVVYIFNAVLPFESLLRQIFSELGLVAGEGAGVPELVNHLHRFLIEEYKNDRNVVLIIDEAQNMPVETLENLRMLSNLETSKDKLVQIIMVGQPEFERRLEMEELRQLKQRIAIRCRIKPLNRDESFAYIQHRLMKASFFHNQVFTKGALKKIIGEARGFPRLINILCDNALITGFGYQRNPVGEKIVKEVIADFRGREFKSRRISRVWPLSAAVFAGIILVCLFFTKPLENQVSREALPGRDNEEVKSFPVPAPSVDIELPRHVPVSGEDANTEQQAVEFEQSGKMESVPENNDPALPEKQLLRAEPVSAEPAEKTTDVSSPEPLLTAAPSERPKDKGWSKRIVIRGDNITQVLMDTYGYCDAGLVQLFKEANPQIKDLNKIEIGEELQLPRLTSQKNRTR